jgi:hypothetical protein
MSGRNVMDTVNNLWIVADEVDILYKVYDLLLHNEKLYHNILSKCDDDMLSLLIDSSSDMARACIEYHPSLDIAKAAIDRLESVKMLDVDVLTDIIIRSGEIERVKYAMTAFYLCNPDIHLNTNCLVWAICCNYRDIVQYMIENGCTTRLPGGMSVYNVYSCNDDMAELLYVMNIPIDGVDFVQAIKFTREALCKDRFIWLYKKASDKCDSVTKEKAIELGWISRNE